jgi:hypothetical protein
MTTPERILETLRTATRPLTVAELARAVLPDATERDGANYVGLCLRRLKSAGKVKPSGTTRSPGVTRGKPSLAWELTSPEEFAASKERNPPKRRGRPPKAKPPLAPAAPCVRIPVPAQTRLFPESVWVDFHSPLHPDTSPEAIAETHRGLVAGYLERHATATAEEISAAVILPKWNVERIIAALKNEIPQPQVAAQRKHDPVKERRNGYARRTRRKETAA